MVDKIAFMLGDTPHFDPSGSQLEKDVPTDSFLTDYFPPKLSLKCWLINPLGAAPSFLALATRVPLSTLSCHSAASLLGGLISKYTSRFSFCCCLFVFCFFFPYRKNLFHRKPRLNPRLDWMFLAFIVVELITSLDMLCPRSRGDMLVCLDPTICH